MGTWRWHSNSSFSSGADKQISRYLIYGFFCQTVQMFMSYDGGATPASIDQIQSSSGLHWSEAELGLLGSLDKLGMTVSSVIWGVALQLTPAKPLLMLGLGLNALGTLAFGTIKDKRVMYGAKFLMGITQGLQCVWSTCWTLARAPTRMRTTWLGLGAICAGLGNGIGTAVAGFGTSEGLPYAFAWQFEAAVLGSLWVAMVVCPAASFSLDRTADEEENEKEKAKEFEEKTRSTSSWRRGLEKMRKHWDITIENDGEEPTTPAGPQYGEDFVAQLPLVRIHTASSWDDLSAALGTPTETYSLRQQVSSLARSPLYLWTALAIASVMFVMSGVQFLWVRIYMQSWGITKSNAVTGFLLCNGVGGAIGVAVGPRVIDRCGGFADAQGRWRSLQFIVCMMLCSVLGGITNIGVLAAKCAGGALGSSESSLVLLWISWAAHLLIFVGFNASLAGLTGINVGSLSVPARSFGSGCTVSIQNLLGYALGPLLPGAIMDELRAHSSRPIGSAELLCLGFGSVQLGTFVALGCSLAALFVVRPQRTLTVARLRGAAQAREPLLAS